MTTHIDFTCSHCGERLGMTFATIPTATMLPPLPCPNCGKNLVDVLEDLRKLKAMTDLLELDAEEMTSDELKLARVAAGLSMGQASDRLGIARVQLEAIEDGRTIPRPDLLATMNYLYGLRGRRWDQFIKSRAAAARGSL